MCDSGATWVFESVNLEAHDVGILHYSGPFLTQAQVEQLRADWSRRFPDNRLLVMFEGASFTVRKTTWWERLRYRLQRGKA